MHAYKQMQKKMAGDPSLLETFFQVLTCEYTKFKYIALV